MKFNIFVVIPDGMDGQVGGQLLWFWSRRLQRLGLFEIQLIVRSKSRLIEILQPTHNRHGTGFFCVFDFHDVFGVFKSSRNETEKKCQLTQFSEFH